METGKGGREEEEVEKDPVSQGENTKGIWKIMLSLSIYIYCLVNF